MDLRSLTLTQNELLVVLQILGASTINGLPPEPLAGLSDNDVAERLNGGMETLQQRNLIEFKDTSELVLDDTLIALVGAALMPEAALLLTQMQADGSNEPHYFSATPYVMAEHYAPRQGIFTFMHMPDESIIKDRAQTLLAPLYVRTEAVPSISGRITDQTLTEVFKFSRSGQQDAAYQRLVATGWSDQAARRLVDDCVQGSIWTVIASSGLRTTEGEPVTRTLIVIEGGEQCWLCEPVGESLTDMAISTASGRQCATAMLGFLPVLEVEAA